MPARSGPHLTTAHTASVDLNIAVPVTFTLDIPPAVLALLDRFTPAYTQELETTVAKLTADVAKLRKSLEKMKAAKVKADADEAAEDEAAAADKAKFEEQIAALQERLAKVPPDPTPEEKAQAEKDQAELDAIIAEFDELDGPDEEPEPEPTPDPTPEPTPEPTPTDDGELEVEETTDSETAPTP